MPLQPAWGIRGRMAWDLIVSGIHEMSTLWTNITRLPAVRHNYLPKACAASSYIVRQRFFGTPSAPLWTPLVIAAATRAC